MYDLCKKAIEENDKETARRISKKFLRGEQIVPEEREAITACASFAMDEPYVFVQDTNMLLPVDEAALQERFIEAKAQKLVRESSVRSRLAQACSALYETEPDRTITNRLCFEQFMQTGLPD